jgi:hypothetical protein
LIFIGIKKNSIEKLIENLRFWKEEVSARWVQGAEIYSVQNFIVAHVLLGDFDQVGNAACLDVNGFWKFSRWQPCRKPDYPER